MVAFENIHTRDEAFYKEIFFITILKARFIDLLIY